MVLHRLSPPPIFFGDDVHHSRRGVAFFLLAIVTVAPLTFAQTASTGALMGTVTDASGAVIPDVQLKITNVETGEARTVLSRDNGNYLVPLLPPGSYRVQASKTDFKTEVLTGIHVNVTETQALNVRLEIGALTESVTVEAAAEQLQTGTSALGQVTSDRTIEALPLVDRNFTQIMGLSTGISAEVTNAAALGRGADGTISAPVSVHGTHVAANNFQMNGVEVNDLEQSGPAFSGGFPVPNPDAIEEFKVQTGQYDASFGENSGGNVNVVTKSGSNEFHGTVFEFLRNNDLNANDFFRNKAGQPRGVLRQNQFGFALGGPVKRDRLLFFASYQGTRQADGVVAGCASNVFGPPLTNNRSAAALGALFAGKTGQLGGVPISSDGSNINPVALKLLNFKLPDGSFIIPTPQTINPSSPFATQGFSALSSPCSFNENQFVADVDFLHTAKSHFSAKFFDANSNQSQTLPTGGTVTTAYAGFPLLVANKFRNLELSHTYSFSSRLFNRVDFGFNRVLSPRVQESAFTAADVGITAPSADVAVTVAGAGGLGGSEQTSPFAQPATFVLQDSLSYVLGRHSFRFGGGFTRAIDDVDLIYNAGIGFQSFPDFLLGLNAAANGTQFSNINSTFAIEGSLKRSWQIWDGNIYVQDDVKATSRLTLNLGLRYERLGDLGDSLGRNANFYTSLANPNPPLAGTLAGYVVPSNFQGTVPPGVTQSNNNLGIDGNGQNTWGPRIGLAWRPPRINRSVLRAGYGIYYQRLTGQPIYSLTTGPPFAEQLSLSGVQIAGSTFANAFPPALAFPVFPPYSPNTVLSPFLVNPTLRPPIIQQYSLNIQTDLGHNLLLEVGYFGARGTQLNRTRSINQAILTSPSAPIRGVTTNTVANVAQRVPIEGFTPALTYEENGADSWYNSLEAHLNKRLSNGLQFLASYTFARLLATDNLITTTGGGGLVLGDQDHPNAGYGPDGFVREQRVVLSYIYELPGPKNGHALADKLLGGWQVAGVTTLQSGHRLTLRYTNTTSAYGISSDRAQLVAGCTDSQLVTPGSVQNNLLSYFNKSCFTSPPVIGDDGKATGFGDSGAGNVRGPGQNNFDVSIIKRTPIGWARETANIEFRAEFFNLFNHPQFSDPAITLPAASFGTISSLVVSPRIVQFALKLNF